GFPLTIMFEEVRILEHHIRLLRFLAACCMFLLAACATTTLTTVWRDETTLGPVGKMAVIGVFRTPAIRNIYEDEFVRQLKAHGVDAVASYTIVPSDEQPDKEVVTPKLKAQGFDNVLVTRLVDRKTVQTYIPGQAYIVPGYYHTWGGYYQYVYTPGYIVEDTYAYAETNIYDLKKGKLIWAARSETEISGMKEGLIKSFVQVMVNRLAKDAMIR
ncbi:MAG TPA: hypothetical protein VEP69_03200, partial [Thermodesulfovibrionales bacterium]|nr:hypothetical protein [Thermodesulfovibrionales bacterium]